MIRGRKCRLIFLCILQFLKCGAVLLLVLELCADVRPPATPFFTTGRPLEVINEGLMVGGSAAV
jgi:hypothetical protein